MKTGKEKSRRKFIKKTGKVVVIAPATGVILTAALKPENAIAASYRIVCQGEDCVSTD